MISHLLNSILMGVLFADLLERRFPQQFSDILFNAIYFYSKAQIYFARVNKKFNKFFETNTAWKSLNQNIDKANLDFDKEYWGLVLKMDKSNAFMLEFIKNGELITDEQLSVRECLLISDFVVLSSRLGDDLKCVHKKISYDMNKPITNSECAKIKFILLELCVGENKYKVDLKTDNYNFYVVGNKFTKNFFIYYLKHYLKIDQSIDCNCNLSLKIIDDSANSLEINFTDKNESILLEKCGYKIVNNE